MAQGTRVITLKTEFEWATHIPDLSSPDFFLWGYLKYWVYTNKPTNITELKDNIREEVRARSVCKSVLLNFALRLKKCTDLNEGHLEQVL